MNDVACTIRCNPGNRVDDNFLLVLAGKGIEVASSVTAHYGKDGMYNLLEAKDGHRSQYLLEWGK